MRSRRRLRRRFFRQLAAEDLSVRQPHHRLRVLHHPRIVGGEDDGGALLLVQLPHQTCRAFPRAPHAPATQFGMNPRTAIHASKGMKETVDLSGQFAIFSLMCARFAVSPVVIPTHTDFQNPAHRAHRILASMLCNERIAQSGLREKMAKAFFKTSRS